MDMNATNVSSSQSVK